MVSVKSSLFEHRASWCLMVPHGSLSFPASFPALPSRSLLGHHPLIQLLKGATNCFKFFWISIHRRGKGWITENQRYPKSNEVHTNRMLVGDQRLLMFALQFSVLPKGILITALEVWLLEHGMVVWQLSISEASREAPTATPVSDHWRTRD